MSSAFKKTLKKNADGTYQVKDLPSSTTMNFDSAGRLRTVYDRDQRIMNFTWVTSTAPGNRGGSLLQGVDLAGGKLGRVRVQQCRAAQQHHPNQQRRPHLRRRDVQL